MKFKSFVFIALISGIFSCNSNKSESENQQAEETSTQEQVTTPAAAPGVVFRDLKGADVALASLKDKVVFMNFWATWCGPCRHEMPSLQALYEKHKSNPNVAFLVVEIDNKPDLASQYVNENKFTFPIYSPASEIPSDFLGQSIPTTVILDKAGQIAFRREGTTDFMSNDFTKLFEDILNK